MNLNFVSTSVTSAAFLLALGNAGNLEAKTVASSKGYIGRTETTQIITSAKADVTIRFFELSRRWRRESRAMSSTTDMVDLASYRQLIGLGADVVPLLLKQLQAEANEPNQWFYALRQITGEDPVPREVRGKTREMAKAWIAWGAERYG